MLSQYSRSASVKTLSEKRAVLAMVSPMRFTSIMSMPTEMITEKSLAENGFYWREKNGVTALICRPLEDAGFVNAFSTRGGGVSDFPENSLNLAGYDEDSPENIEENRRRFLGLLEGDYQLASAWQMHSDLIKPVKTQTDIDNSTEKFDGLVCGMKGVVIGVKTADCIPVLLGDPSTGAFAAIHAGWRGTVQSIVPKAIEQMKKEFGTDPGNLIVAIGPAALVCCYEIGQDVIDAFHQNFSTCGNLFTPTRESHAKIDLHTANKEQLLSVGVKPENIYTAPLCTIERTDLFFSYRVEKKKYGKTGRLMSVIAKANK